MPWVLWVKSSMTSIASILGVILRRARVVGDPEGQSRAPELRAVGRTGRRFARLQRFGINGSPVIGQDHVRPGAVGGRRKGKGQGILRVPTDLGDLYRPWVVVTGQLLPQRIPAVGHLCQAHGVAVRRAGARLPAGPRLKNQDLARL